MGSQGSSVSSGVKIIHMLDTAQIVTMIILPLDRSISISNRCILNRKRNVMC